MAGFRSRGDGHVVEAAQDGDGFPVHEVESIELDAAVLFDGPGRDGGQRSGDSVGDAGRRPQPDHRGDLPIRQAFGDELQDLGVSLGAGLGAEKVAGAFGATYR